MSRKLILLVDDDPDTLEAYAVLFQALGHATASATDGASAVAAALQLRPDLMLLDIGLPHMSGLEVMDHIRADADGARLPVIVITGRAFPDQVAELREHGCRMILIKPCEPVALCEAVEAVLHSRPAASPQADRARRDSAALRVRPKPTRTARSRPVESGPRSLEALYLHADFLMRTSEGLRQAAGFLRARARDARAWSRQLRLAVATSR